ncbi:GNAT family N-acetyltransferase [Psychromonas sp. KJ10-10]|uniref:GNAT family N-acetyltransferase n=1 Tax=Psychromonas sp. KJ10-10 TaxID=3391823 RepID=UPI0039B479C2
MNYQIQPIHPSQDQKMCFIIKSVGKEFGAIGDGFGPSDPEVEAMSQYYSDDSNSCYLIATINGLVVGGCGIATFNGDKDICELRKLFISKESRGLGLGIKLTEQCLAYAQQKGYKSCYLDTLSNMQSAIKLYEKLDFKHLPKPLDGTIHNGCDVWMLKQL